MRPHVLLLAFPFLAASGCHEDATNASPDPSTQQTPDSRSLQPPDSFLSAALILPRREDSMPTGDELISILRPLKLADREARVLAEVLAGNVPDFMRRWVPVTIVETRVSARDQITYFVTPDYFSIGSDSNYFRVPMTPILAQEIADSLGCLLPTRKMVDEIWAAAEVKLEPIPIPPGPEMTTIPVFEDHRNELRRQRSVFPADPPLKHLVAGHKKDVILSNRLRDHPDKVIIYGWHDRSGKPIQPLYSGHVNWYADYSHGVRLIKEECLVNGEARLVRDLLSDPNLYDLLSDENAPMSRTRYPVNKSDYP